MTGNLIGRIILGPDCVAEGAAWLTAHDPIMQQILSQTGPLPLRREAESFGGLLYAILSQQVSVASARALWARLEDAELTRADRIGLTAGEDLRALGLSRQKGALCQGAGRGKDRLCRSQSMPRCASHRHAYRRHGHWPVDCRNLCHVRAWPRRCFRQRRSGAARGGQSCLWLAQLPTSKAMAQMAQHWSPWRAVAARALWSYYALAKACEGIG